ncbi:MAG: N-acetyltransferase [Desulfuromonadales bacterium]|nr:N-acetyltransferase [Desulfuromonadales bacterium]
MTSIHPTVLISPKARIGEECNIGPYTIIHDNVVLGRNVVIGSHCEIGISTRLGDGSPLYIGDNSLIRSHSVFYESSSFGDCLVTGHHVCARELTHAGKGLQIGSASDIQGHCEIGDYVRTHRGVHIGQKSKIGNFVWLYPDVLLTNDPNPPSENINFIGAEVGDFTVISAKSTLLPGVKLGKHVLVAAQSLVGINVPDKKLVTGVPAKIVGEASMLRMKNDIRVRAYPWNKRFYRGYPEEIICQWREEE